MEEWKCCTIGDVVSEMRNGINCQQDKKGVGYRISRIETISDGRFDFSRTGYASLTEAQRKKHALIKGDILFSHINSDVHVGKVAILDADEEIYHGVNLMLLRAAPEVHSRFLYYGLHSIFTSGYWRLACKKSVNQASVNQTDIKLVPFAYPSLDEQKRIVTILDVAFEGIDKARANTEKNLANARELFTSCLREEFARADHTWRIPLLGEHVRFIDYRGKTPPKTQDGIRLITAKNVKMGYINREPEEFMESSAYVDWMTRGFPRKGDVLFTTEAPLGNIAQLDTDEQLVIGQRLITMQPDPNVMTSEFLKYRLMSPQTQEVIWSNATGATVQGIKAKILKLLPIPIPAVEHQKCITEKLDKIVEATKKIEQQQSVKQTALRELRSSLLAEAFSGRLANAANLSEAAQ